VLAVQRPVRRHVRDGLVPRPQVPVARGAHDHVAGALRPGEAGDLDDRVGVVGVGARVVRRVGVEPAGGAAERERVAAVDRAVRVAVGEARRVAGRGPGRPPPLDHGAAARRVPHLAPVRA
jgi:hypothetical protein